MAPLLQYINIIMPKTLYRIIDTQNNSLRANAIPDEHTAQETVNIYNHADGVVYSDRYSIESYTLYTVKGLGRDPDLHYYYCICTAPLYRYLL